MQSLRRGGYITINIHSITRYLRRHTYIHNMGLHYPRGTNNFPPIMYLLHVSNKGGRHERWLAGSHPHVRVRFFAARCQGLRCHNRIKKKRHMIAGWLVLSTGFARGGRDVDKMYEVRQVSLRCSVVHMQCRMDQIRALSSCFLDSCGRRTVRG